VTNPPEDGASAARPGGDHEGRPYYATKRLARPVHSRGDGLSSSVGEGVLALFVLEFGLALCEILVNVRLTCLLFESTIRAGLPERLINL
jgi:hypothetical protein